MNRRSFVAGLSAVIGGGSALVGTGAFTSVSAERSVSMELTNDNTAFLRMKAIPNSNGRSISDGENVALSIPGSPVFGGGSNAEGVGLDSVYEFENLVRIWNQGTQPVRLYSAYDGTNLSDLALIDDGEVLRDDPPTLGVGDDIAVGLYIDTHGSSLEEFDETLTIVAEKPGE